MDRNRDGHPHIIREMKGEGERMAEEKSGEERTGEEGREEEENVLVTLRQSKPHVSFFVVFLSN